jgi:hypothetical protein
VIHAKEYLSLTDPKELQMDFPLNRLAVRAVLTLSILMAPCTSALALGSSGADGASRFQEPLPENGRCEDRYPFPTECGPRD